MSLNSVTGGTDSKLELQIGLGINSVIYFSMYLFIYFLPVCRIAIHVFNLEVPGFIGYSSFIDYYLQFVQSVMKSKLHAIKENNQRQHFW